MSGAFQSLGMIGMVGIGAAMWAMMKIHGNEDKGKSMKDEIKQLEAFMGMIGNDPTMVAVVTMRATLLGVKILEEVRAEIYRSRMDAREVIDTVTHDRLNSNDLLRTIIDVLRGDENPAGADASEDPKDGAWDRPQPPKGSPNEE